MDPPLSEDGAAVPPVSPSEKFTTQLKARSKRPGFVLHGGSMANPQRCPRSKGVKARRRITRKYAESDDPKQNEILRRELLIRITFNVILGC